MSRVGAKGNIVIDRKVRAQLGIQPGWEAIQTLEGDRVVIQFLPPVRRGAGFASLRPRDTSWLETDEALEGSIRDASHAEAARGALG
jgi:bifunctional DNA-binding transcriptional regulator/antitoxin component of YhaV-PrlF toxin-antitoxin module